MVLELFGMTTTTQTRICLMTLEALGLEYDFKTVDLFKREQFKPEFVKLSPQRSIPLLRDGAFVLDESRAIATYLASAYGNGNDSASSSLYPSDVKTRAVINQRLHFDSNTFYHRFGECVYPLLLENKPGPSASALADLREALAWASSMIEATGWAAATDHLTLADLSFVATFATCKATAVVDLNDYPVLEEWFERVRSSVPNYEKANGEGAASFGQWFKSKNQAE